MRKIIETVGQNEEEENRTKILPKTLD